MTLVWTRVDQKLIHGQITVAWVPHLSIDAIVVSDSDTAEDSWVQKVMMMGLPPEVRVARFTAPANLAELLADDELSARRVMVIFKDINGVLAATGAGLQLDRLNLGNQACQPAGHDIRLTDAFYASESDLDGLAELLLDNTGLEVIIQAVPAEKGVRWAPRE